MKRRLVVLTTAVFLTTIEVIGIAAMIPATSGLVAISTPHRVATSVGVAASDGAGAEALVETSQEESRVRQWASDDSRQDPQSQTRSKTAAERIRQVAKWRGTEIKPAATAKGHDFELHREIASSFFRDDPLPEERLIEFDWYLFHPDMEVSGWYGAIESVAETGNELIVDIRITPRLMSMRGGIPVAGDFRIETWSYDGKELRFLKMGEPPKSFKPLRSF